MKMNFENNLKKYTENIKEFGRDMTKEGRVKAEEEKQKVTTSVAEIAHTDIEAESEIYKIQKSKLEKLSKFKKWLEKTRDISSGNFVHPEIQKNLPVVSVDNEGNFTMKSINGQNKSITIGEIMTDHEWNIDYTFDKSVNIHDIRTYYLNQLKDDLREKLDKQIIISETSFTRGDAFQQEAYKELGKTLESGNEQQGVIAEKMVKNFLKKLSLDTNADFEVLDANAYQDVHQKIDFIIHRKNKEKNQGAKVEESDTITSPTFEDIGIQFTINTSKTEHKEKQISRSKKNLQNIDDLVLVTLPAHDASKLYDAWKKNPQSGGPEKMWNKQIQETVFRGVMAKIMNQQEIYDFCVANFK
jgi:hypothetical protein